MSKTYQIDVTTSVADQADTRAPLYIILNGATDSPETQLKGEDGVFPRGSTCSTSLTCDDLGDIKAVSLRIETGATEETNDPWLPESIQITDTDTGTAWAFKGGLWLGGDGWPPATRRFGEQIEPVEPGPNPGPPPAVPMQKCWSWGEEANGRLGNGTLVAQSSPTEIPYLSEVVFTQVAAGDGHNLALLADGTVWAWGLNNYGQLGDNTVTERPAPVEVQLLRHFGIKAVAAGATHSMALSKGGVIWSWGRNNFGQLGAGYGGLNSASTGIVSHTSPARCRIPGGAIAIAAGMDHSLALDTEGKVWTWGCNTYNALGDGSTTHRSAPRQVVGIEERVTAIAAGERCSFALTEGGDLWAWGYNNQGRLGLGDTTNEGLPQRMDLDAKIVAVATNCLANHTLILLEDGTIRGFGDNGYGQLGTGEKADSTVPVQTVGIEGNVTAIAVGTSHSLALTNAGEVYAWGRSNADQVGLGETTYLTPQKIVVAGIDNITSIDAGSAHNLIVS